MKLCCVDGCVTECMIGRNYCREHYLKRKREQAKLRYKKTNTHKYKCTCEQCNKEFLGCRKKSRFCSLDCYYAYSKTNSSSATNMYSRAGGGGYCFAHRRIAEELLGRRLNTDEVVHHIDGNPNNNSLSNLLVISRKEHVRLHAELTRQRAALLKNKDVNSENCWNNLIDQITTTWLETTGVKVIRISDIGRSAAETPPAKADE